MQNHSPRRRLHRLQRPAILLALLLAQVGCDRYRQTRSDRDDDVRTQNNSWNALNAMATSANHPNATAIDGEHWHRTGAMGGYLTSLATDRYHAELVIEAGGQRLNVYFMRDDETELTSVPAQFLTGYYKPLNRSTSQAVMFIPEPLAGDKSGTTSRLVGHLGLESLDSKTTPAPSEALQSLATEPGAAAYLAIPGLVVEADDERRYMLRFHIASASDHWPAHSVEPDGHFGALPDSVAESRLEVSKSVAEELQALYLTPGGKYTEADIAANGKRTAAEVFADFRPQHDPRPQAGDLICPITRTKANRNCKWIIDGQSYFFCCPPCIDEFLAMAKQRPDDILPAAEYQQ